MLGFNLGSLLMRRELINELNRLISLRECAHIKARSGLGLTTLLKSLDGVYAQPRPLKPMIQALAGETKGSVQDLIKLIDCESTTLLIDDSELITKSIKGLLDKLINQGLVIVTGGSRNVFSFNEYLLKPLSLNESIDLVNKHLRNRELARVIAEEVGGKPVLIMNAVRKAKARSDLMTAQGFNEFKDSINSSIKRVDLINYKALIIIAGVLMSARYLFYLERDFSSGYLAAMIGYVLLTIGRVSQR